MRRAVLRGARVVKSRRYGSEVGSAGVGVGGWTCTEPTLAHFCTAMRTIGWMIGSRMEDMTRSASERISGFWSERSRWNELTDSSARSGWSPAWRTRYM